MCQGGTAEIKQKNRAGQKHQSGATENPELNSAQSGLFRGRPTRPLLSRSRGGGALSFVGSGRLRCG